MSKRPATPKIHERELVAVGRLTPHPKNYRTHPEDQLAHIAQSIREHGFYRNVVVAEDDVILAGHGVVLAAERIGLNEVPVVRLPIPSDSPKALKLVAADNELGRFAIVDDRELSELLANIREVDIDGLLGTGYDDAMLANLLYVTRPMSEIADFDAAAHWVGLPGFGGDGHEIPVKLVVSFDSIEDRARFVEECGIGEQIHKKLITSPTWSAWWPPRERQDLASLRFEDEDE